MTLMSLLAAPAFACGGMVPTEGSLVSSESQRALFELGGDSVTVTYEARYKGNAADFAWVIAVPGAIQSAEEGDAALLDSIAEASAPQVTIDPAATEENCGCGGNSQSLRSKSDDNAAGGNFADTGVEVTGHGFAGNLEYTTLSATDADALKSWLDERGYDTTLIASTIAEYVADDIAYEWVAVRATPEAAQTDAGVDLDPLRITYTGPAMYPAKLASSSQVEYVRTEIYVLASGFAELGGWEMVDNGEGTEEEWWDLVSWDGANPESMYTSKLLSVGDTTARMWLAFAGSYDTADGIRWLTRYDTMVRPATNTLDATFSDTGEQKRATTEIYLMEEGAYQEKYPDASFVLGLGCLGFFGWRRRRGD